MLVNHKQEYVLLKALEQIGKPAGFAEVVAEMGKVSAGLKKGAGSFVYSPRPLLTVVSKCTSFKEISVSEETSLSITDLGVRGLRNLEDDLGLEL